MPSRMKRRPKVADFCGSGIQHVIAARGAVPLLPGSRTRVTHRKPEVTLVDDVPPVMGTFAPPARGPDLEHFVVPLLPPVGEVDVARGDVRRTHALHVAAAHCLNEGVPVDDVASNRLLITAERRCRQAHDPRLGEVVEDLLPGGRDVVVSFIDDDQVEVVSIQ